jgi:hypothetical protein
MKRILLVSLHFPPLPVVASERAIAIARELHKLGWQVDVLTHDWQKIGNKWEPGIREFARSEEKDGITIHRIGAGKKWRMADEYPTYSWLKNARTLGRWARGWLDARPLSMDSHEAMHHWMDKANLSQRYDLLFGVFSPHTHLRLLHVFGKKTGIPVHVDFRDLWDNMVLSERFQPSGSEKLRVPILLHYWKKWLKTPISLSTVSLPWRDYLHDFSGKPCVAFGTGFHPSNYPEIEVSTEKFLVLHAGTLYSHQKLEIIVAGISLFLENESDSRIAIEFPGALRPGVFPTPGSYLSNPEAFLRSKLNDCRVSMEPRIDPTLVRKRMKEASVLIMPTFPGVRGLHSGKLFDYLGAGRFIAACPSDMGVIAETIETSGCGKICFTAEELAETLHERYKVWKEKPAGNSVEGYPGRELFSQENQIKKLSDFLSEQLRVHPKKK